MALAKMLAKAATKANKNAGGIAAAGAVAGVGGAGIASKKQPAKKPAAPARPPASTLYNKGGSVTKTKKYNTGGDVEKTGYDKGIKARTVMSDAVRRRMEESGLEEPMLTKAKPKAQPASGVDTGQYNGKRFQVSAERKAKQEAEKKRLINKPLD